MKKLIALTATILSLSSIAHATEAESAIASSYGSWSCQVNCGVWTNQGKNISYQTAAASSNTAAKALMDAFDACWNNFRQVNHKSPKLVFGKVTTNPDGTLSTEPPTLVNDCVKD